MIKLFLLSLSKLKILTFNKKIDFNRNLKKSKLNKYKYINFLKIYLFNLLLNFKKNFLFKFQIKLLLNF